MFTERGVITAVKHDVVVVLCRSKVDCQRCAEGKGCGGGILARWLGDRNYQIQAVYDQQILNPAPGALAEISLPAQRLVKLAALTYGLPILLMVLVLLSVTQFFPKLHEVIQVILALLSLYGGFKLAAYFIQRSHQQGELLPTLQSVGMRSTSCGLSKDMNS